MREIVRTNDAVLLSFVRATLADEGVEFLVADGNMSVLEGSLGVLSSRVLVAEDDVARARRVLTEIGLAQELRPDVP
ncbi:DUF2007 domain-containing protein [Hansschlegelia sp. KR7-227]|uniref:putative signal transducing protein n=1 Tax=Hansschlegelia sp. KR7-227 TaxID=3400914 RepID=UPI003BFEA4DE